MKKLLLILFFILFFFGLGEGCGQNQLLINNLPNVLPIVREKALEFNFFPDPRPEIKIEISGQGGIVVEQKKGKILFRKNGEERFYPASTTKIMTALLALEIGNLEEQVTVSKNVLNQESGSKTVFLNPGDQVSLEVLLYGLLLESGNDCAIAIAEHLGGSEAGFVQMMNNKATELGLKNTHFANPHGLYNPDHYTSPKDLAVIARAAFKYPKFREIIGTMNYRAEYTTVQGNTVRDWTNTNKMIDQKSQFYDERVLGSKTGYTQASQYCLVTFARKEKVELIIVVLQDGKDEVYLDTLDLLEAVR